MSTALESVLGKIRHAELAQFLDVLLDGPNVRSPVSGETPLHIVAIWGDVDSARVLLDAGAEIDVRGEEDCTPLHEAIMQVTSKPLGFWFLVVLTRRLDVALVMLTSWRPRVRV